jgi:hypothetical protein
MERQPAPTLPTMNEEQKQTAEKIRGLLDIHQFDFDQTPLAFKITDALGIIIDGIGKNLPPPDFLKAIEVLRLGYLALYGEQHMSALAKTLGDPETVEAVLAHTNGRSITNRIFERIGPLMPGQEAPDDVEVRDILEEEGFYA